MKNNASNSIFHLSNLDSELNVYDVLFLANVDMGDISLFWRKD